MLTFLLMLLFWVIPARAQVTFPPCFPWCYTNPPWITPTKIPTATPTIRITPTVIPTVTPTPAISITPTPTGNAGVSWGAYVGDGFDTLTNVTNMEGLVGKKLTTVLWYQAWGVSDDSKNFKTTWMNNVKNHGSIPLVTWEPWNYTAGVNQPQYRLANITNGTFDSYIRKWAQDSKAWGFDYYLRPMHEMNGNWYPWSASVNGNTPQDYVNAWKRIKDIFVQEGSTNAKFVWCPNVNYPGSTALSSLYPGDAYVDWLCMDGYNWGDINGGWQELTALFTPTYNQLTALSNKPIMIGEMASAEQGGSKSNWITTGLGSGMDSMPQIKAFNWFNANKEKDWRVNSSQSALNAFKQAIIKYY